MEPEYVRIIGEKPTKIFIVKYFHDPTPASNLIIISPHIGTLNNVGITLEAICRKAQSQNTRVFVITNCPKEKPQIDAIDILKKYGCVEIRYNEALHAKLYICLRDDPYESFGMLGSSNFTQHSINQMLEIGMMIFGIGKGKDIIEQLKHWSLSRLRILSTTRIEKKFEYN